MQELTLDIVNRALKKGDVSYILRGDIYALDPIAARELILSYVRGELNHDEVDLTEIFD